MATDEVKPMKNIQTVLEQLKSVAKTHEKQQEEFKNQLKLLKETEMRHENIKEKLNDTIEDVTLLNKKIVTFETSNNQMKIKQKSLQSVIENTLRIVEQKKRKLEETDASVESNKKNVLKHERKMAEYLEKVETAFESEEIYKEASKKEEEIANMKKQRDEILSEIGLESNDVDIDVLNNNKNEMNSKIERYNVEKFDLTDEYETLQTRLDGVKKATTDLEQEIRIVEKHNNARLLRLKSQLKKAQEVVKSKRQFM